MRWSERDRADRERSKMADVIAHQRAMAHLFCLKSFPDTAGHPAMNRMVLSDELDGRNGKPALFAVWRPPRRPRRRQLSRRWRGRYTPVVAPLRQAWRDLVRLGKRAVRWLWRSIDPDGGP
jgi:hypothetical protein